MGDLFIQDIGFRGNPHFFLEEMTEIVIAVAGHFTEQRETDVLGEILIDEFNDILDGVDGFVIGTVGTLVGDQELIQKCFSREIIKRFFLNDFIGKFFDQRKDRIVRIVVDTAMGKQRMLGVHVETDAVDKRIVVMCFRMIIIGAIDHIVVW